MSTEKTRPSITQMLNDRICVMREVSKHEGQGSKKVLIGTFEAPYPAGSDAEAFIKNASTMLGEVRVASLINGALIIDQRSAFMSKRAEKNESTKSAIRHMKTWLPGQSVKAKQNKVEKTSNLYDNMDDAERLVFLTTKLGRTPDEAKADIATWHKRHSASQKAA